MSCAFFHCRLIIYYCSVYILSKSVHTFLYHNIVFFYFFFTFYFILVRHSSHWGRSLQDGLRDEQTCGTTLASVIYCAICLPCGRNFRWWGEVQDRSKCWLVCCCWTPKIKFNKRLSSLIIRLVNYNVTTSLIYKWKV